MLTSLGININSHPSQMSIASREMFRKFAYIQHNAIQVRLSVRGIGGLQDAWNYTLLTVTRKFSKKVLLIPGLSMWSAAAWADVFLAKVTGHDWGVPLGVISDRDSKFMSEF